MIRFWPIRGLHGCHDTPPAFDPIDYRGRNVVERQFNLLKQWCGLATRYDKPALVYRSAVVLHAAITRTKASSDKP